MKRYNVENKHERDRGNRDKDVLREEKCALESEKVKYFGTKWYLFGSSLFRESSIIESSI